MYINLQWEPWVIGNPLLPTPHPQQKKKDSQDSQNPLDLVTVGQT